jgi:hypothetical protein
VRPRRALPAVLLAVLALTGCVTTAVDSGAYVENGKAALDSTISATASEQLALQARLSGDAPRIFTDVVVTESKQSMARSRAASAASTRQPPRTTPCGTRSSTPLETPGTPCRTPAWRSVATT